MRLVFLLAITHFFISSSPIAAQHTWPFSQNYTEAFHKAQQKKSLLYLHFTASWCMPCVWMAENTYQNEQVLSQLKSFIPVSIDIESPEGKILQDKFQVEILPTLLIVNAQSEQPLARKEKSLSGVELNAWLTEVQPTQDSLTYFIEVGQYSNLTEAFEAQNTIQKILQDKITLKEIDALYFLQLGNYPTAETAQYKLAQLLDLGINGQIKSF